MHAEGGHDGSESRCEIGRARKFNDVAGGGAHKVGKSRGGVGVEVREMREVSQARGFAGERFRGAREEGLGSLGKSTSAEATGPTGRLIGPTGRLMINCVVASKQKIGNPGLTGWIREG